MRRFFLARITSMGCEGVIEGFVVKFADGTVTIKGEKRDEKEEKKKDDLIFSRAGSPCHDPDSAGLMMSRPHTGRDLGGDSNGFLLGDRIDYAP